MEKANVICFPLAGKRTRKKAVRSVDGVKYFNELEIKLIRRTAKQDHETALAKGQITGVRNWMIIDLLTCTGLRVSEASNHKICDLRLNYGQSEIYVSNGKGNISGTVIIPKGLKTYLKSYISWKQSQGEGIQPDDYLLAGQRGKFGNKGIQQIVKDF